MLTIKTIIPKIFLDTYKLIYLLGKGDKTQSPRNIPKNEDIGTYGKTIINIIMSIKV